MIFVTHVYYGLFHHERVTNKNRKINRQINKREEEKTM